MLTPKQGESAATALTMRPVANRNELLACPACGSPSISPTTRRHVSVFNPTPCPHCGALLRLKWGRAAFAAYLLTVGIVGVAAYMAWPRDRHLVQSFASPFIVVTFVVFAATLRRLPVAACSLALTTYKNLGLLAMLIMASTGSCAFGSTDAQMAQSERRADQTIAALVQMSDADSLAAAGLMSIEKHSDQALALLTRAVEIAPDRADLVWVQALRCAQVPSCDPEPSERRLRELIPTNGAGWWGAIARAGAAHDSEGVDAALTAISHTERVDIYWTTLISHLSTAVAKTKKMSIEESEVAIIGYAAAQSLPPYQYISTSCKGERLQQPGVTETCRGVAKALQNGDTYITEMIGVAIAKRVWPEDSAEWKAAAEERRVYDYRSKFYLKLERRTITHPGEYLTLCAQNRREQDVFAARLTAAGFSANPPTP